VTREKMDPKGLLGTLKKKQKVFGWVCFKWGGKRGVQGKKGSGKI